MLVQEYFPPRIPQRIAFVDWHNGLLVPAEPETSAAILQLELAYNLRYRHDAGT